MKFNNPIAISLDIPIDGEVPKKEGGGLDLTFDENGESTISEETKENEETEEGGNPLGVDLDLKPVEEEEEEEVNHDSNLFLKAINDLTDSGIIQEAYEGFDPDKDPDSEVLVKLLEHNLELRDSKVLTEFINTVSPLAQRILSYDLNKGENLENFLKTIIEENNIKNLKVDSEYDQERIVRLWYSDEDYTPEEIEEKIDELKKASLLEKEAGRVKPKLDARAEQIAKQEEESQAMLRKIELQRKEQYIDRVEEIISKGKVGNITLSKETAQKVMALLILDDMKVKLPEGREVKMSYLDAEIMKHKYSSQGNPELLVQAAYLLTDPEGFYKQFANAAKTEEVNKFTKEQKYNLAVQSQPVVNKKDNKGKKESKNIPWRLVVN